MVRPSRSQTPLLFSSGFRLFNPSGHRTSVGLTSDTHDVGNVEVHIKSTKCQLYSFIINSKVTHWYYPSFCPLCSLPHDLVKRFFCPPFRFHHRRPSTRFSHNPLRLSPGRTTFRTSTPSTSSLISSLIDSDLSCSDCGRVVETSELKPSHQDYGRTFRTTWVELSKDFIGTRTTL